jgi:DNA (cytosine-5)-methyltransferase 1
MACDIDEYSKKTYEKNYGISPLGDILDINSSEISDFDILCAGYFKLII